jgi:hypothetical protein
LLGSAPSGGLPVYPTKICKFCVQPIPLDALVCKFCTRDVNTEEEATEMLKNYVKALVKQREQLQRRRIIIGVGILVFFGLLLALGQK